MIKEFCMACRGTGISGYYNSATSHKVIDCDYCQGKGYTELEYEYLTESGAIKTQFQVTLSGGYRKFEVYIKEIKKEKE